jgi:polar amino acid transport system substrate-binding protein
MNKKNLSLSALLLFLSLIAFTANGFASDTSWDQIKEKGELVVGFCAQYPPFEFKTETGELKGFDVDLANAIGKELGLNIKFKDGEWQGLIAGMKKGDYDVLITCMGKTAQRMKMVNFSDAYVNLTEVIVVRKDENEIQDQADLKGKVVGAQMASSSERALDKMADHVGEIKRFNYTTEAFLDLKFKRIDALISGVAYAINQIKTDPSFKIVGSPLSAPPIGIALPKGADALTAQIDTALATIRANGTYAKIYDRWLTVNSDKVQ